MKTYTKSQKTNDTVHNYNNYAKHQNIENELLKDFWTPVWYSGLT